MGIGTVAMAFCTVLVFAAGGQAQESGTALPAGAAQLLAALPGEARFLRGCVFRLNRSQSSTRRGLRSSSLIVGATGLPRPRTGQIAGLRRQLRFSGPCPLRDSPSYTTMPRNTA